MSPDGDIHNTEAHPNRARDRSATDLIASDDESRPCGVKLGLELEGRVGYRHFGAAFGTSWKTTG